MRRENHHLKMPGILNKIALMAGLAMHPQQAEPEPRLPVISRQEYRAPSSCDTETQMTRLKRDLHPSFPPHASLDNTLSRFYSPEACNNVLERGFDIGMRAYEVLFAEDLAYLDNPQPSEGTLEADHLFQLAERSIDQEIDQLPEHISQTEHGEDYRERMRAAAKDTLLLALRQDLLSRMSTLRAERALDLAIAFSDWDPTWQILPPETEEQSEHDGNLTFSDRAGEAILQDLSHPLPRNVVQFLLYERVFGDLQASEDISRTSLDHLDPGGGQR